MPRFFFHVNDGEDHRDCEGTELEDVEAAREEAVAIAGELLKGHRKRFWAEKSWELKVKDQAGAIVCRLRFSGTMH